MKNELPLAVILQGLHKVEIKATFCLCNPEASENMADKHF